MSPQVGLPGRDALKKLAEPEMKPGDPAKNLAEPGVAAPPKVRMATTGRGRPHERGDRRRDRQPSSGKGSKGRGKGEKGKKGGKGKKGKSKGKKGDQKGQTQAIRDIVQQELRNMMRSSNPVAPDSTGWYSDAEGKDGTGPVITGGQIGQKGVPHSRPMRRLAQ